ncbi:MULTISPECIES: FAD-dependent oxidoreductase [unclassified Streptomyces]|uniref:NAD(P)/FAD-dependent oxidoreductase n=1 Tax=unclassified Streptomyces TaxID=2593676 RepID=UPI000380632B|nr:MULTISPECIES: FAD-dependent oxidoreductase [unclassified Streptomyces]MYT29967.1 FAD-dependent oxidoreductase [Streptomyces sp. SID8354]
MSRNIRVDVAVVGNGLIGMSTALHLRRRYLSVAVIGGTTQGRASTAAAGMLTPACEYDPWMPEPFYELLHEGLDYYPHFLSAFGFAPETVGYRSTDFTLLDLVERPDSLQPRTQWMDKYGIENRWLSAAEVCDMEPQLSPRAFRGAIRIKGEAVVNPRALLQAMTDWASEEGSQVFGGGLAGVGDEQDRLRLTTSEGDTIVADRVVIAAGSWSGQVGRAFGLQIPVCPVKGQILRLAGPPGLLRSVVFMPSGGCGSIVSRSPGEYIVGTSEEYLRPEADNTAGVVGAVLSRLCAVVPEAAEWRIDEMWSGFRPMTSDELPIVGRADDPRIVVATGHHRNGVLLTPVTGRLVAALVDDEAPGLSLDRFRYGRPLRPHTRFATKY